MLNLLEAEAALAAFAYPPFDARSVCIVAVDGPYSSGHRRCVPQDGSTDSSPMRSGSDAMVEAGSGHVRPIGNPVDAEHAATFFQQNSSNLSPRKVYRAKTWARFDKQLRLPFVDVDLLPVVERDAGMALKEFDRGRVRPASAVTPAWTDPDTSQGHWTLQTASGWCPRRCCMTKASRRSSDLDLHDVKAVLDRVGSHHSVPANTVSRRRLLCSKGSQRLLRVTRICDSPQPKRSHSCTRTR